MWHQVSLERSFLPACKKCPWLFFLLNYSCCKLPPAWLTVVANRADLEAKFLVPIPKIRHRHVDDGERVGQRSVKFQHRPLLARACLQQRNTIKRSQKTNASVCVRAQMYICVAHLTPVIHCTDVMCVLVRQLLSVAASEAECVFVAVGGGVQPGGGVEAVVGEGLLGCRAQQLQEGQLDHVGWNAVRPGVGKLEENTQITHTHINMYTER